MHPLEFLVGVPPETYATGGQLAGSDGFPLPPSFPKRDPDSDEDEDENEDPDEKDEDEDEPKEASSY